MGGVSTPVRTGLPREAFDQQVEERLSDDDIDYSGWFCIATDPFPCPAEGCDFVANHQTAAHHIVVWPEMDDMKLLRVARDCRDTGRHPRIVEYERSMGPCISWDLLEQLGFPAHGIGAVPDGWYERPGL